MRWRMSLRQAGLSGAVTAVLIAGILFSAVFFMLEKSDDLSGPVRIMPLGDSITQSKKAYYSYRYYLWMMLIDADIDFDFVGTKRFNSGGNPGWPDYQGHSFDCDHEGRPGWRADELLKTISQGGNRDIRKILLENPPDIVLLHIGSNDIGKGADIDGTTKVLRQIVETLQAYNPNIVILLAKLIPSRIRTINERITKFNSAIEVIGAEASTESSLVIVVDQNAAFDILTDMSDPSHPNEIGEKKMAEKWFEALQPVIKQRFADRASKN